MEKHQIHVVCAEFLQRFVETFRGFPCDDIRREDLGSDEDVFPFEACGFDPRIPGYSFRKD